MIQALSHRVNSLLQKNLSRSRYRIARRTPSHPQPTKMFALAVSRAQVTLNINGLTLVFLRRKVASLIYAGSKVHWHSVYHGGRFSVVADRGRHGVSFPPRRVCFVW